MSQILYDEGNIDYHSLRYGQTNKMRRKDFTDLQLDAFWNGTNSIFRNEHNVRYTKALPQLIQAKMVIYRRGQFPIGSLWQLVRTRRRKFFIL
ncbi:unnamed protein product [Paramecium octaurelia]|uniref:Uncharacterized protein n=1 Tax=Paramecium octaurelia TaxID=43137 RepID=A0A8S1UCH1_PAROT|nr:unnamed protein product [Paramecium octaurelia]